MLNTHFMAEQVSQLTLERVGVAAVSTSTRTAITDIRFRYTATIGIALLLLIFTLTLIPAPALRPGEDRLMNEIDVARIEDVNRLHRGTHTSRARPTRHHLRDPAGGLGLFFVPFLWTIWTSLRACPKRRDSTCCRTTRACGRTARS